MNNPPPLQDWDLFAWQFYMENATAFTRDFNLMPGLIMEMNLETQTKRLFLKKLDMIHRMWIEYWEREQNKNHG